MKKLNFLTISLFLTTQIFALQIEEFSREKIHNADEIFSFKIEKNKLDFFEIKTKNGKIFIAGNSQISVATGLNWFLRYYTKTDIFSQNEKIFIADSVCFSAINERRETRLTECSFMNYCTFSYSTAFWDWEKWRREIDKMALWGVNRPLATFGAEGVWAKVLQKLGFTDTEIAEFLPAPNFMAWLLMGNLQGHFSGKNLDWVARNVELQQKILARMRAWGMEPILHGFSGSVPKAFLYKFPNSKFVESRWVSKEFSVPPVLLATDELFPKVAEIWYSEQEKLFGKTSFFAMDLFHESGAPDGVDIAKITKKVQKEMLRYNKKAVWYAQAWEGNPSDEMLNALDKNHARVIDLAADHYARWRTEKSFLGAKWLFSHITNYGGNVGLHGRLATIADGISQAHSRADAIGVAATPEGIGLNEIAYELGFEMRWRREKPDLSAWVNDYCRRRYGAADAAISQALATIFQTAYASTDQNLRQSESLFCAAPEALPERFSASTWGHSNIYYSNEKFGEAVKLFLQPSEKFKANKNYVFDAVDFVRQFITNLGNATIRAYFQAKTVGDTAQMQTAAADFLRLLQTQDELLSAHEDFFVGTYINEAKSRADSPDEAAFFERALRLQLSTWSLSLSALRDYAHKEWGGLLRDLYLPRWQSFFNSKNENFSTFEFDIRWRNSSKEYNFEETECLEVARNIFFKLKN